MRAVLVLQVVRRSLSLLLGPSPSESGVRQRLLPVAMRRLAEKDAPSEVHLAFFRAMPDIGQDKCCLTTALQVRRTKEDLSEECIVLLISGRL